MNNLNQMVANKEKGFTLIELVMVIVILGILAAFALPRFADLGGDARAASIEGARGAVKSAVAIARSAYLAKGSPATVDLDGTTIDMANGYPNINQSADGVQGIRDAAQLSSDFVIGTVTTGTTTISLADGDGNAITDCNFTYNSSTGFVSDAETGGC